MQSWFIYNNVTACFISSPPQMVPCTLCPQASRRQSELSSLELRNSEALEQVQYAGKGGIIFWRAIIGRP